MIPITSSATLFSFFSTTLQTVFCRFANRTVKYVEGCVGVQITVSLYSFKNYLRLSACRLQACREQTDRNCSYNWVGVFEVCRRLKNPRLGESKIVGDFPLITSLTMQTTVSQRLRCSCISCFNSTSHIVKMV